MEVGVHLSRDSEVILERCGIQTELHLGITKTSMGTCVYIPHSSPLMPNVHMISEHYTADWYGKEDNTVDFKVFHCLKEEVGRFVEIKKLAEKEAKYQMSMPRACLSDTTLKIMLNSILYILPVD